jgi:hypothetical protein
MYMYVTNWSEIALVGNFHLHITDLLFSITAIYCIVGALTRWYRSALELALLVLNGLLVLNFGRGTMESSAAAGVEFREFSGFIGGASFVYFWGRELNVDWVFDKIVWLGWGIAVLGAARLLFGLDAFILDREIVDNFNNPDFPLEVSNPRTLNGAAALMLGQAMFIALIRALSAPLGQQRWVNGVSFIVFAVTLLISRQRTATFATCAGLAIIIGGLPVRYRTIMIGIVTVALITAGVIFGAVRAEFGGDIYDYLPHAFSMITQGEGTFGWRLEQWGTYFDLFLHAPLVDQLIGQPMNVYQPDIVRGTDQLSGAHSQYFQLLRDAGAAGVLLFTWVVVYVLFRGLFLLMVGDRAHLQSNLRLATAIVASQAIYSIGYALTDEQGLLLAIALQLIVIAIHDPRQRSPDHSGRFVRTLART